MYEMKTNTLCSSNWFLLLTECRNQLAGQSSQQLLFWLCARCRHLWCIRKCYLAALPCLYPFNTAGPWEKLKDIGSVVRMKALLPSILIRIHTQLLTWCQRSFSRMVLGVLACPMKSLVYASEYMYSWGARLRTIVIRTTKFVCATHAVIAKHAVHARLLRACEKQSPCC